MSATNVEQGPDAYKTPVKKITSISISDCDLLSNQDIPSVNLNDTPVN